MSQPIKQQQRAKEPEKGAFPLDHFGECTSEKTAYLRCLRAHEQEALECRELSKAYLECRMRTNLMQTQPLSELGFVSTNSSSSAPVKAAAAAKTKKAQAGSIEGESAKEGFVAGARRARSQWSDDKNA